MDDNKKLEEANKEIERSKAILHDSENLETKEGKNNKKEEEGSGIFTTDGKELPKIDGGYDLIDPGGTLSDDALVSV